MLGVASSRLTYTRNCRATKRRCSTYEAVVRHVFHAVVYPAKQVGDKVIVGHGRSLGGKSGFDQTSTTLAFSHGRCYSTSTKGKKVDTVMVIALKLSHWSIKWLIFSAWFISLLFLNACSHGPVPETQAKRHDLSPHQPFSVATAAGKIRHDVYVFAGPSKQAPPILLLHEIAGLSSETLDFAEMLSKEFTVYVPSLFGNPNERSDRGGMATYAFNANGEWWESDTFEGTKIHGSRPIVKWLSVVVDTISTTHNHQPMGVIGMCLTGAMPLSLVDHEEIKALVLAQPTLPMVFGKDDDLGISAQEWEQAKRRAERGDLHIYGVRYQDDSIARRAKHCRLKHDLGKAFTDGEIIRDEYCPKDNKQDYVCPAAHSSLIYGWKKPSHEEDPMLQRRQAVRDFLKGWLSPNN
jgi:dienelactone hydrolase